MKKISIFIMISLSLLCKTTKTMEYHYKYSIKEINKMEKAGWDVKQVSDEVANYITVVFEKRNPTTTAVGYSTNSEMIKDINKNVALGWKIDRIICSQLVDTKTIVIYIKD